MSVGKCPMENVWGGCPGENVLGGTCPGGNDRVEMSSRVVRDLYICMSQSPYSPRKKNIIFHGKLLLCCSKITHFVVGYNFYMIH